MKDNLLNLNVALRKIRDEAAENFHMNGVRLPWLPTWGFTGSIDQWYNWNDNECMATCFRVEVERFLSLILAQQPQLRREDSDCQKEEHIVLEKWEAYLNPSETRTDNGVPYREKLEPFCNQHCQPILLPDDLLRT